MNRSYVEAIALGFPHGDDAAPSVTVKGELDVASHIVAFAKKHGVPVIERPELCEALGGLPLDEQIPRELFEAAAAVLAEVGALRAPQSKR